MRRVCFVLGGARSGKSRFAEELAEAAGPSRCYIATSEPFDAEMQDRIARHRERRGAGWDTVGAPTDLVAALDSCRHDIILVDCLTLWLNNLVHHGQNVDTEVERLRLILARKQAFIVIVSNELGLGLVPDNSLARRFRDLQGQVNQRIAALADEVYFMAAGLPLVLKSAGRVPEAQ
jgi:adenosylcobinamide kinase / adenosylcobinamide-phosphate guanylyltransferase